MNLMVHLQYHHRVEFEEVRKKVEAQEKEKATSSSGVPGVPLQPVQCTIKHSFELASPMPRSSAKWKALTHSICYCITKDMLPIITVNDSGFRNMLSPRYTPPDRTTFARNYIPATHEHEN